MKDIPYEPINIIYQTAKDSIDDTINTSLEKANADCGKISVIDEMEKEVSMTNERLEQTYDKLFEVSYHQKQRQKEIKKSRSNRCPDTYFQKVQQGRQRHEQYEVIWQIGDMEDMGYESDFYTLLFGKRALLNFC